MTQAAQNLYNFSVNNVEGKQVSLDKYRGYVVIVVNVASDCGLTAPNYTQLKSLQDKYYDQGLRVAAFPCNQFGWEERECATAVVKFVKDKFDYEPDLYDKIHVNGGKAPPLYKWLKHEKGGTICNSIKWNFSKFLINRKGEVVKRFSPTAQPETLSRDIEILLAESE